MLVSPDISNAEAHTLYMYAVWQMAYVAGHRMPVLLCYINLGRKYYRKITIALLENRRPVGQKHGSYG